MQAIAIIPARYDSTRFPGKVLADRTGKPLVQHVYERAIQAMKINRVAIATDDRRVADAVRAFGGEAIMTRGDHPNGTSRIAEAVAKLDQQAVIDGETLIVNVQGDEPEIDPAIIDLAISTLEREEDCLVATIASPFASDEDPDDPNIVKVVVDGRGRAMYFSRARIPFENEGTSGAGPLKHIGLYVYRRPFLDRFIGLEPTPLERSEKLEQLRIMEHGYDIAVAVSKVDAHGIDTPQQYEAFVQDYLKGRQPTARD